MIDKLIVVLSFAVDELGGRELPDVLADRFDRLMAALIMLIERRRRSNSESVNKV